jgi:ABC-type sugar transport system substrate-binding protein
MQIGLFLIDDKSLFQKQQESAGRSAAATSGAELDVFFAGGDATTQRDQMFGYLRSGLEPAAIIVEPAGDAGLRFVAQEAARKGCGCVIVNRTPSWVGELGSRESAPVFCVTADHTEIGHIQGEQFRALLPAGGTLLYITGPGLSDTAQVRLAGMKERLGDGFSSVLLDGAWTEDSGHDAVRRWLDTTRGFVPFSLIGAQNDDMAMGAKRAAAEAARMFARPEWETVPVTGVDGMPEYGRRLVDEKALTATVIMPTTTGEAVRLVVGAINKAGQPPTVTTVPVTPYPELNALRSRH